MKEYIIINIFTLIILFFNNKKNKIYLYFLTFVFCIVLFEVIIAPFYKKENLNNHIPYCYFAISCGIFYLVFYYFSYPLKNEIYILLFSSLVFIIFVLYYYFGNSPFIFMSKIYLALLSVSAFLGVRYLKFRLNEELTIKKLYWDPYIYFTFGLLIFYTTSFPLLLFLETLIASGKLMKTYSSILKVGNIFLSLGYLGAAICIRKEAQSIG